jgi:hypothetical protein
MQSYWRVNSSRGIRGGAPPPKLQFGNHGFSAALQYSPMGRCGAVPVRLSVGAFQREVPGGTPRRAWKTDATMGDDVRLCEADDPVEPHTRHEHAASGIRFETRVTSRMHAIPGACGSTSRGPAKLFATPSLHRASRFWREPYVVDREARSRTRAVWDLSPLPLAGTPCGDRRHVAALVFQLQPLRVRMVCSAVGCRWQWPQGRGVVGDATCPTAVSRRGSDVHRVSCVWRTGAGPQPHDDVVPLLPLPHMRAHLVGGEARGTAGRDCLAMPCRRCGGVIVEALETFPYVGPRGYVVELRDVHARRCVTCGVGDWQLPALRALDVLIRVLASEQPHRTPQLVFKNESWRVAAWSIGEDQAS